MTREDILRAAFQAWGNDAYRTMSLSDVAARLGVTKPALYRHFRSKDELQEAMMADFFDRFTLSLRELLEQADGPVSENERLLNVVEGIAGYYARYREDLVFTFARLLGMPEPEKNLARELRSRGFSPTFLAKNVDWPVEKTIRIHFALATCFFSVALFHMQRGDGITETEETEIREAAAKARSFAARGLAFARPSLEAIDYAGLDRIADLEEAETAPGNGLLPAIAAAVAEAGPWNASMEMVARRSGLSKSGLYAHFKSREEMLMSLFLSEFRRIALVMVNRSARSEKPVERLYLAIAAAAQYLLARQDVLLALDWIRAQRVELKQTTPETVATLFGFLSEASERGECVTPTGNIETTARWILFLVVNMLMRIRKLDRPREFFQESLRALHACLCVGIEGW